ncbi:orotidine 5'-phosphate decarboxylase [Ehrlichia chaffeensis str. Heartland]|uniref:Orotidine 5'-phosphate decarboxylase n=1 Tax=Ehrlichia chaffeensis (strain ATCC CRL-10679 / Arkansas) TaxID=205920 RepID=PYRF_EHRCR|nr:orotidine-5'-phosphate decarboxylase [Ehrlichia chaffeensis]Q2GG43.1 RecName: Full=Orotidine 5'-phosphate decarboxylase; AltName: Full=OMP decarboxylase; Short=OMPDCase; Short=OMPdecase [Ehrlichia chaffeensis str. Arkansas]ABD45528.1 orotidine 5'-phosphate decarboxylase [Ehrlichia chaffeensis str. Arkansas]AHX03849.1 orotidine 5'-phosphate decarboxylase [Ehrlichia chaffeensis str. Heartland]AHX05425.1 orotidine 5'-phosphate decarboxylase [Ehrlichia chaffeensis str. Jax]AHX06413.1 orotidine 
MFTNPIICALDTHDINHALLLTKMLYGRVSMVKLGLEFFTAYGLSGVQAIADCGVPIFLDLKLHDIPNTVSKAISVIASLNVAMLTIHVSGGREMMIRAMDSISGSVTKLVGVTVLTSMDDSDLKEIGVNESPVQQVMLLSKLAREVGLYGIVCSAFEAKEVRNRYTEKDLKLIVPGIRFDSDCNDQKRVKSPKDAMLAGANYLVIGRPITMSSDPVQTVEDILLSISKCI